MNEVYRLKFIYFAIHILLNRMNKKALLVGASGLIGHELLKNLLDSDMYETVTVLVRTPLAIEHPKLIQQVSDFKHIDQIKVDHVFCTIGTTIKKAGSKEEFIRIDKQIPLEIAQICHQNGASLFALVTAMGAAKNSMIFYNKVKGEVEEELAAIGFEHVGIFRPSMLLGDRPEKRLGESIGQKVMSLFDFIIPNQYKAIHVKKVADAMLKYAERPKEGLSIILSDVMLMA
jgi:uncharacterized protein YbjT (DUF2867 family)